MLPDVSRGDEVEGVTAWGGWYEKREGMSNVLGEGGRGGGGSGLSVLVTADTKEALPCSLACGPERKCGLHAVIMLALSDSTVKVVGASETYEWKTLCNREEMIGGRLCVCFVLRSRIQRWR